MRRDKQVRFDAALALEDKAECDLYLVGGELRISNEGHHWKIRLPDGTLVEWWPATARIVCNQIWKKPSGANSWQDAFRYVQKCAGILIRERERKEAAIAD